MRRGILPLAGLLAAWAPAVAQSPAPAPAPTPMPAPASPPTPLPPLVSVPSPPPGATFRWIPVFGAGSATCQTWLAEPQNGPDHRAHQQWLAGFLSGYNIFNASGATGASDSAAIEGWIDHEYCPPNPTKTIAEAAISLVNFTRGRTNYPALWGSALSLRFFP